MRYSDAIRSEQELEELLSTPSPALIEMMKRLDGDLMILGIAGKMGLTMGRRAARAIELAGVKKKVVGVSRFSKPADREKLEAWGIETIPCDLLDREQVRKLPRVANVVFMAGRKFGTDGSEELTWAMNTLVPGNVVEHFKASRIVAFSTGCVYPLVGPETGGCTEAGTPRPGRRVFAILPRPGADLPARREGVRHQSVAVPAELRDRPALRRAARHRATGLEQ